MELNGSKTEANLMSAFAGESQATNKYVYYAEKARKEGFEQIGDIFEETSGNEREHAEIWFKILHGGSVHDTLSNLKDAAGGEHFEWTEMYKEYAEIAKQEGFLDIASKFELVAAIEYNHEARYRRLIENIEQSLVFARPEEQHWKCLNCGHVHVGKNAPQVCPTCSYPQGFFEINCQNY